MEAAGNEGAETKRKLLLMKWSAGGEKKSSEERRMCMLKIQPELGLFHFCFSLAFASLN